MTKVAGPLLSVKAKGTLGNAITYQGGFGGHRVTKKPDHKDCGSAAQLAQRQKYRAACDYWNALNDHEKEMFDHLGNQHQMTGFNYCVREYLLGRLP